MPDIDIGTTTRTNAPRRLQPSIIAASSTSLGIALKKPSMSHEEKGTVKEGYTSTNDHNESSKCKLTTTRDKGMNSSVGGTRYVRKMPMPSFSPHRPVRRANAYP